MTDSLAPAVTSDDFRLDKEVVGGTFSPPKLIDFPDVRVAYKGYLAATQSAMSHHNLLFGGRERIQTFNIELRSKEVLKKVNIPN